MPVKNSKTSKSPVAKRGAKIISASPAALKSRPRAGASKGRGVNPVAKAKERKPLAFLEEFKDFIGIATDLPPDYSVNHRKYRRGALGE
ncbi:hypothetical protein BH09SUM1_BH09SUM1_21020 [soil metagenome]